MNKLEKWICLMKGMRTPAQTTPLGKENGKFNGFTAGWKKVRWRSFRSCGGQRHDRVCPSKDHLCIRTGMRDTKANGTIDEIPRE
jgi:hypothetical protein